MIKGKEMAKIAGHAATNTILQNILGDISTFMHSIEEVFLPTTFFSSGDISLVLSKPPMTLSVAVSKSLRKMAEKFKKLSRSQRKQTWVSPKLKLTLDRP